MDNRTFYNEILTAHNLHPYNKHPMENPGVWMRGVNPSCGDDILLQLTIEDGVIKDGSFVGTGCAFSQASADIMLDLILGKTTEEALRLKDIFLRMIKGGVEEEELDELDEAVCLRDVSHMPTRVKCAVLGWHTLEEILKKPETEDGASPLQTTTE